MDAGDDGRSSLQVQSLKTGLEALAVILHFLPLKCHQIHGIAQSFIGGIVLLIISYVFLELIELFIHSFDLV
jgi:hypothetical protein